VTGLILTGQGDVMKESVSIALSYLRSRPRRDLASRKLHVHVPAGAVPKEPSAGVTMTTALVSLASGRPVNDHFGMTGEVTPQGRVPHRRGQQKLWPRTGGLTDVIIPK
jgi:ATP-dependent Lon protease